MMITYATLRALLSKFEPATVYGRPDGRADYGVRSVPAAAYRVDGWYNFEMDSASRFLQR